MEAGFVGLVAIGKKEFGRHGTKGRMMLKGNAEPPYV